VTDYHSIDALSNSSLSVLYGNGKGDPAGFHARFIAKTLRHEETDAMRLGSAVHMLALEPERFASEYFVTEGPINPATKKPYGRGTIAYKDWLDSLAIEPNRKVIIEEDWCESLEIAKAFQSHPNIVSIMASKTEKVFERGYEMQFLIPMRGSGQRKSTATTGKRRSTFRRWRLTTASNSDSCLAWSDLEHHTRSESTSSMMIQSVEAGRRSRA